MAEETFGFGTYLSPFTTRYGSREMRELFSQLAHFASHRRIWADLARAQELYGLVSPEERADIEAHLGPEYVDIGDIRERDRRIRHDLMSHVESYAAQCAVGGRKIHLGGTSMDIEDNEDIKRSRQASEIVTTRIVNTLDSMRPFISYHADTPCVAWTHLQPAGYTTIGYRFSNYAQDLLIALEFIEFVRASHLKGKGMKGIAGTSSSYVELLGDADKAAEMELEVMKRLGIDAFPVATQVYPRVVDFTQLSALSAMASVAHKFALGLRLLSGPFLGEMFKKPKEGKVGSSAAPWKLYNPTEAERINSLARYIAALPNIAWQNQGNNILERTLDDSANRRIILAEGYLAADQMMIEYDNILRNMGVRDDVVGRNLRNYGIFMNTEPLMMEGVKRGADRQAFHGAVRRHIGAAYERMLSEGENPLPGMLADDEEISRFFGRDEIAAMLTSLDAKSKTGDAGKRAKDFLETSINPTLERYRDHLGIHVEPEF